MSPVSEGSLVPATSPTSGRHRTHPYTPVGNAVVNCIQTVSVSDLIQQGGRAGRVAPGRQYIMASEEQIQRQVKGPARQSYSMLTLHPCERVQKGGDRNQGFPDLECKQDSH